jgi:hypothetical protein
MVLSDSSGAPASVLLDEKVDSVHIDSEHSAWQFIERLGWAISDAEEVEHAAPAHRPALARPLRARVQSAQAARKSGPQRLRARSSYLHVS